MAKKTVIEFVDEPEQSYGLSTNALVTKTSDTGDVVVDPTPPKKRGPGRPSTKNTNANQYTDFIRADNKKKPTSLEEQYEKGYTQTVGLLAGAIQQTQSIYENIETELQNYRKNRAYGGKSRMMQMTELMNTQMSVVNTKINAIRELNNVRNKINDLVMRKTQMDKDAIDENSDKAVMDAYYAMINASQYGLTPMQAPLAPSTLNTGVNMSGQTIPTSMISGASIIPANPDSAPAADPSFDAYKANLTPVQRKMILDNDPNIKTVVVYDQGSGNKYFDVVNVQTGQSVPGVTRPAEFLLDNMRIDARNGIAVNSNVNQTYPLVIVGSRVADEL